MKTKAGKPFYTLITQIVIFFSFSAHGESGSNTPTLPQLMEWINELSERVREQELKLSRLNEKINSLQVGLENKRTLEGKGKAHGVSPRPQDVAGTSVPIHPSRSKDGFDHNDAIARYQSGQILFDGEKYSEAILAFSSFLKDYTDHALAGDAQFHIGKAYFQQNELELAKEELERGLKVFSHSAYVPESLALLTAIERKLGSEESAMKYQQLLQTHFPLSPAAVAQRSPSSVKKEISENHQEGEAAALATTAPMPES